MVEKPLKNYLEERKSNFTASSAHRPQLDFVKEICSQEPLLDLQLVLISWITWEPSSTLLLPVVEFFRGSIGQSEAYL